jgi:hypothetical protein
MQAHALTPFSQQSQAASQVILGPYAFVQGVKKLGSVLVFYLLVLVLSPVLLIVLGYLWILLWRSRKQLSKELYTQINLTSDNYSNFRQEYLLIKNIRQRVLALSIPKLSSTDKIALRFFQVSATADILESRIVKLETAISSLNPKPTSNDDILVPVSEDELWGNRTKAYTYIL